MPIGGIEFRITSTQQWVDVTLRNPSDEDGLRLRGAGNDGTGYLTIIYADIPGNSWNQQRLNRFVEIANERLVYRIPLANLPAEDPDKTTDPNQFPKLYWNNGDLCSRAITVSNATFVNNKLSFTITKAY